MDGEFIAPASFSNSRKPQRQLTFASSRPGVRNQGRVGNRRFGCGCSTANARPRFFDAVQAPGSPPTSTQKWVAGVNTARSLAFKGGRISHEQVARVRALFCGASDQVTKIIVTHHPFDLPEGYHARNLVGRSQMALSELRECPPDLLLSGHLHLHRISSTSTRYDLGGKSAIVVQAGTVISTRGRGETNSFNLVRIQRPEIVIERFDWASERRAFETASKSTFSRRGGEWVCSEKTFI